MYIIGIDPGTTTVGYAVLESYEREIKLVDFGIIQTTAKEDLPIKLVDIGNDIQSLIEKYSPEKVGIEKLFFNTNITTGIQVAHARGVIMHEFAKKGILIYEFTPLQVKKAVTGNGQAKKEQLQKAIQILFQLDSLPTPDDAADAIAIAYMTFLQKNLI